MSEQLLLDHLGEGGVLKTLSNTDGVAFFRKC